MNAKKYTDSGIQPNMEIKAPFNGDCFTQEFATVMPVMFRMVLAHKPSMADDMVALAYIRRPTRYLADQ